jgi:hypothetical protein
MSEPRLDAVYSREAGDDEFLPFWKLFAEHNYQSRWVSEDSYRIEEKPDRAYILHVYENGLRAYVMDREIASKTKLPVERVTQILTCGSREERKRLLQAYVNGVKKEFDRVERVGDEFKIHHLITPLEAFKNDVLEGKIFDPRTGRRLSLRQAQGKPPEGGFLQKVLGGTEDYYKAAEEGRLGYRRGVVVKICGDCDPRLKDHHNTYAVITKILDPWHYEVVQEYTGERLVVRDTDIKAIIGDIAHDFVGIGDERHRREVIPIIRKALEGKIPIPETSESDCWWPRPPVRQALVVALTEHGKFVLTSHGFEMKYPNQRKAVGKNLKKAERWLKTVEKRKMLYEPEDYRREHGKAVLWVKLYRLVLSKLERLEKGEQVTLLRKRSWDSKEVREAVKNSLSYAGIPYAEKPDGIYVCSEDYHDACKALQNVVL